MVDKLSREQLLELAGERHSSCVSIYAPPEAPGREALEGPIRFKNLVSRAEEELIRAGMRSPDAHALLRPARDVQGNGDSWRVPGLGIALFAAPNFFRLYRLPIVFEPLVVTGERFHIKPLLPALDGDGHFYVLALSQGGVRLLEADRRSAHRVELGDDVPKSLDEAMKYDDPEVQRQFHTRTDNPSNADFRGGVFFGTGAAADRDNKDEILRWFKDLEDGVERALKQDKAPLVLAGVEYLLPLYRQASSYRHIVDDEITGNQEEVPDEELRRRAWELIEPRLDEERRAAVEAYAIQAGRGTRMNSLGDVVRAAHDGRIDTLFVPTGTQIWGRYDPVKRIAEVHDAFGQGDQDLLDLAAVQTLAMGGTVYAVAPEAVPGGGPVAAVVRY